MNAKGALDPQMDSTALLEENAALRERIKAFEKLQSGTSRRNSGHRWNHSLSILNERLERSYPGPIVQGHDHRRSRRMYRWV
jgi:hypothetical protein